MGASFFLDLLFRKVRECFDSWRNKNVCIAYYSVSSLLLNDEWDSRRF